jgi:hypothetical protein
MIYSEFEEHTQKYVCGVVRTSEEITVATRVFETLADCDTRPN